jgi:hypothetical protein
VKKLIFSVVIATVVIGIFVEDLLNPALLSKQSLVFIIKPMPSSNNVPRMVSVVLSNASQYPVLFKAGDEHPWFKLSCLSNSVWTETSLRTIDDEYKTLKKGEALQSILAMPKSIDAARLGMSFTSLTWRGRFAYWLMLNQPESIFGPLQGYLIRIDMRSRSTVEWSDVMLFQPSQNEAKGPVLEK